MFPDRADYFPSGFFRDNGDSKLTMEVGSVAEYENFIAMLASKLANRDRNDPTPGPFMEVIYFSPFGKHYMIGPKTSEKLAADFKDRLNDAEKLGQPFSTIYRRLMESFAFAAKSGAVRFTS